MEPNEDPVIQGRRLRAAIRSIRLESGRTQRDVASALYWSASKVVRIESGDTGISVNDLRAFLELCGVENTERAAELVRLARMSRRQNFARFRDIVAKNFLNYLRLESSASTIRTFESTIIPGLLQTEEYARAIIGAYRGPDISGSAVSQLVQLRMERQELLDQTESRRFSFIIDESALRRFVGDSPDVMQRQLDHLVAVAGKPNVAVGVIPFRVGQYTGMAGPFVHLEFSGPGDDDSVYLETGYGEYLIRDAAEDTRRFLETFFELEAMAERSGDLLAHVERVRRDFDHLPTG